MSYWYETPGDQKGAWHWTGIAISLAYTVGLHQNHAKLDIEPHEIRPRKRLWWSCLMRDRLVGLGLGRPTRIKDEDYDVAMITEDDYEIMPLSNDVSIPFKGCMLFRDIDVQRQLAQMCIAKAKLCLCIGHILDAQCWIMRDAPRAQRQGGYRNYSKTIYQSDDVERCDKELSEWINGLPDFCEYGVEKCPENESSALLVHKSLLNMLYLASVLALHIPQILFMIQPNRHCELLDISRAKVRNASRDITSISQDLHARGLQKYLPTTAVTVIPLAMLGHLLDIKSCHGEKHQLAMDEFCQCMVVLEELRERYPSADFAIGSLEGTIQKAGVDDSNQNKSFDFDDYLVFQ